MTKNNDDVDEIISNLINLRSKTKKNSNTIKNYYSKKDTLESINNQNINNNQQKNKKSIIYNKKFKFINKNNFKGFNNEDNKISNIYLKKQEGKISQTNSQNRSDFILKNSNSKLLSNKLSSLKTIKNKSNKEKIDNTEILNTKLENFNKNKDIYNFKEENYNNEIVIEINNVSRNFKLNSEKVDNIKEYTLKKIKGEIKQNTFYALNNVTFSIKKGERWGIIGLNGAGKSTLLKIIAGVMKPSSGTVKVSGKIAPLLELGAGFDYNFTGAENIYLNGSILGYSREFLEDKFDEIVEFSELKEFIDVPIKNYSSGMISKLGFSIATLVNPDILILDEVLAVGDVKFRKKSGDKLREMFNSGVTVILVSHAIGQIKELCDKVIWLEKGSIVRMGDVDDVCDEYLSKANMN